MFSENDSRSRTTFFIILALVLIFNIGVIGLFDLETSRLTRLMSIFVFGIYYGLVNRIVNVWTVSALGLLFIRDIFFQFYEQAWGYKLYLIFGTLCYLTIVLERLPKFSKLKFKPGVVFVTGLLVALNTYTLYIIMNMQMVTYTFHDSLEPVLFYVYGASMMILGVQAILYNNKYNSNRSLLYTFFAFGFIFSDIAALFAYYFEFDMFYFFDRFFFIIATGLLVQYGLNFESVKEEYYQYEMIDKKL
ncbi:hypothetical protein [Leeuwenhoekiella nanhaiensis]|uniref:YhhN-like protein n=1 Tax=Leeuwenhoekiella nanhaiensis TaxID=1655491 RepID=A0A2G1VS40_9FLAO|nr:hypothetical protein [Leeuwenhoekiella nanhaiensis]PHQ29593.1 hypothetical protein CJ305_09780 [Leeuwenhoekiella nanhaiensis]